jgi:lipopolysaccharide/colanic/teichoic acid biosynthesis glycosyltransferase
MDIEDMFLTRLIIGVRKLAGRYPEDGFQGLHSLDKLRQILERERARADRTGDHLSLLTFAPRSPEDVHTTLVYLAKVLRERLRSTDEAGWLEDRLLGVVLPNTEARGAWKLADDVCLDLEDIPSPICTVYSYPSDRLPDAESSVQPVANVDQECGRPACSTATSGLNGRAPRGRPALELDKLFVQSMPVWKRLLDVLGAAAGLLMLLPVFAIAAVAIKLSSPGPVIFRQRRSGRGGQPFVMYKFRTMVADAETRKATLLALNEQDGPAFKVRHDPRVTPVGRFLRRTSLDELPQLWNILKGDMSLVGPRPLPCAETDACERWHRRRLHVTPGLTCIWQVEGRSLVSFADWVRMDLQYIRSRSLRQDLKLLLLTVPAVVSQKGAR